MSVLDLEIAKKFLDVIHGADDDKLQLLLDAAEAEALDYMGQVSFEDMAPDSDAPSEGEGMPPAVKLGVLLLLQAAYQASPDDIAKLRAAAEVKLQPLRRGLGV